MSFLGMGARIFREIWASSTFFHIWGLSLLDKNLIGEHTIFGAVFQKGQHECYYGVPHVIGVWLGTKVVKSALRMLALYMLYMYFNGTGIWGGETIVTSHIF